MLPSTPQVESVYLDPAAGILAGLKDVPPDTELLELPLSNMTTSSDQSSTQSKSPMRNMLDSITVTGTEHPPHTILIDQTTLDPTFAMSLAEKVQSETLGRALVLDAPVSGGEHLCKDLERGAYSRNDCCYQWEFDNHVWFPIRFGFWPRCTITTANGKRGGRDPMWQEWNRCRSQGLQ